MAVAIVNASIQTGKEAIHESSMTSIVINSASLLVISHVRMPSHKRPPYDNHFFLAPLMFLHVCNNTTLQEPPGS